MPPLPPDLDVRSFAALEHIITRLRAPDGCPWDRAQTHDSLRPFLLEEAYETAGALDDGDITKLREELGDLLLQIMLHSQIASEAGQFDVHDVIEGIATKLLRRHPHVFGDTPVETAEEVVLKWEAIKERERGEGRSALEGVTLAMPALAYSQALQERAAATGFEWPRVDDVLDKLSEEVRELREASTPEERREELGDVLWLLVSLARKLELDAEDSLRAAARRFVERFTALESLVRERSLDLSSLPIEELESLWRETRR
ncbi:MAG: nucleoside triphosphate pyrophosphohydrolase [Dehalococcoidia bacterium]|nr:nucleoside triphosphate pyrophosphohydrolase [Dehalococcoidia bacterium]